VTARPEPAAPELDAAAEDAWRRAAEGGIHRLAIPTPFMVGRVNCYLIEDEPLTLVDTGPNWGKALDELHNQLAEHGHSIDDIELVIITHQHMDHFGLVDIVAQHSGAEVAGLGAMASLLETYGEDAEREDEFAVGLMLRSGIPEEVVHALRSVSRSFRSWGASAKITRPLSDGEAIGFRDRTLQVLHRPGHSPSDTIFWDAERRILLAADHLIAHVSSNPLISRPLDGKGERTRALVGYLESLRRTRELPAEIVLSGHGDPITDHASLIDQRLAMHERRAEKIYRLIAERPRTGYELAQALWGNVAVTQTYLTLSEVIGHLDLLLDTGRVREVDDGRLVRYEADGGGGNSPSGRG
jgi:glyoxylase-like metal-dependent hydrolase (beta-lactamase superfamily II)